MIQSVNITQRVITARVTSGGRETRVTLRTPNRVHAAFIGTQGPSGASAAEYVHTQSSGSAEWVVNHNLGRKPNVAVYDTGSNEVVGQIVHMSDNQLRVYFAAAQAGFARCV